VEPPAVVLHPRGALDLSTSPALRVEWYGLIAQEAPDPLVVDMNEVTFLGSHGLSLLAGAARRQREGGRRLAVRNASPWILHLMTVSGVITAVEVWPAQC